jgi:RimJ/RimL family protein N-acetyltransferase
MEWAQVAPTLDETRAFLGSARAAFIARTGFEFCAFLRSDGRLVGAAGIAGIDWTRGRGELGYWVRVSAMGHGYATEAVTALTDLALTQLGLQQLQARVAEGNTASEHLLMRLGFVEEPKLRSEGRLPDGRPGAVRTYVRRAGEARGAAPDAPAA